MAYRCIMWLKEECDGCGRCQMDDEKPMGLHGAHPEPLDDDGGNPFEIDYDDER